MKRRIIDWFLLIVALVGGVLAWQTGRERIRLAERYDRLVKVAGELPIGDPSKVYFRALDTGEPLHFAWRVYLPRSYAQTIASRSSTLLLASSSGRATECIARVRFRRDDRGNMEVYAHFTNVSTRATVGDERLADLMRGRWAEVRVEQLGSPNVAVLKPDQTAVLLRLALPDDIQAEIRRRLPTEASRYVPVLFEFDLGSKPTPP